MPGRRLLAWVLPISTVAVLGLVGNAYAAGLKTGATRYVRVVQLRHGKRTLKLTRAGEKRFGSEVNGKFLIAKCVRLRRTAAGLVSGDTVVSVQTTRGSGGRRAYISFVYPHTDFCDVELGVVTRHGFRERLSAPPLDNVPVTERGAGYLNEDRLTFRLLFTIELAQALATQRRSGHFPPARVLSKLPGTVALRRAKATPPEHNVGYYTNGSDRAEVVGVSALGQRLFINIKQGIFSTNAEDHIIRGLTGRIAEVELPALPPLGSGP